MFSAFFKKIGELLLGEFKTTLIDRLSRVETKIEHIENGTNEIKTGVKDLENKTSRLQSATHEIQGALTNRRLSPLLQEEGHKGWCYPYA